MAGGAKESRISSGGGAAIAADGANPGNGSQPVDSSALVVNEIEALIAHVIVDRLGRFGAPLAVRFF